MTPLRFAIDAGYALIVAETAMGTWGLARWQRLARNQKFVVVWLVAAALIDVLAFIAAKKWHSNQEVSRLADVVSMPLVIEALIFRFTPSERPWVRLIGWSYVVADCVLAATIEPLNRYAIYSYPLHGVVVIAVAMITVQRCISRARRDLLADPAFLIAIGFTGIELPSAFKTLIAASWLHGNIDRVDVFYAVCSVVNLLALCVLARALQIVPHRMERAA